MDIKDLKDLPNGTAFVVQYINGGYLANETIIRKYEYIKICDEIRIICDHNVEYGIECFYNLEDEIEIVNDKLYLSNGYFEKVKILRIKVPKYYKHIYYDEV